MNENTYIHHTPGRLRVRVEALKNNPGAMAAVRNVFAQLPGVVSVETNLLIGSITVIYDSNGSISGPFGGLLCECHHTPAPRWDSGSESVVRVLARKLGRVTLNWAAESALSAAFAALI